MAGEPEFDPLDSVEAQALRSRYRCTMCHKHCPVPCRFTGAEFRELVATWRAGGTLPELIATAGWDEPAVTGNH